MILSELQRQVALEQYNEQHNHWAFLASVITNGFSALSSTIAGAFGGKRRKPKMVGPDDFLGKDAKKVLQRLLGQESGRQKQADWSKHLDDVKAKGLRGPR